MSDIITLFPQKGENKPKGNNKLPINSTPEEVMGLIQPQSSGNNTINKLAAEKINELLTRIQGWLMKTKNSDISSHEFMAEFLIPTQQLEELCMYSDNTIQDLGFQQRYNTIVGETLSYIAEKLGLPKGKDTREEIFNLYDRYRDSTDNLLRGAKTPDAIKREKMDEWNPRKIIHL